MADLMGGVPDIPQVMIWGPAVVSDNHRVYGKKGKNTPSRARAREGRPIYSYLAGRIDPSHDGAKWRLL